MEQALEIFRRHADEGSILIIYNNLGVVAREQGDDAHAVEYLDRSLRMARRLGVNDAITRSHLSDMHCAAATPVWRRSTSRRRCAPRRAAATCDRS
jgi:Tfp pilus assembly protein PilF